MRLVIDLQSCQNGAARQPDAVLALAQALARQAAPQHVVLIALDGGHGDSVEPLRLAFAGLLPAAQVLCYALPAGAGAWRQGAAELIRDAFLAELRPDAVLVPGLFDRPLADSVCGAGPAGALRAYTLADAAALGAPAAAALRPLAERQRALLGRADLVLAGAAAETAALAAALAPVPVLAPAADDDAEANAAALWRALEDALARRAGAGAEAGKAAANAVAVAAAATGSAAAARPKLAFVSPLPPEKSGIADYSAELLAELAPYYDIELVSPQAETPLAARWPLRTPAYFERHAGAYQRVLYHFGNSNAHQHMFGLLERHPGVVVLHDFFLSGVLDNMERDGVQPQAFLQALYASHGYSALFEQRERGRNAAIWAYPCNRPVLEQASGVIVHADFSRQLAERWYGAGSAAAWRTLPLLRGLPAGTATRAEARRALGVADDAFLVCSFGMLGATKLNERLLAAFLASPLAARDDCRLVFVGDNDAGPYGAALLRQIADSGRADRIGITGFVTAADYQHYLAACDVAVQLRCQTRGETSASVLDCLLHGVPTIINAHGAAADLPDAVLLKLADEFSDAELTAALAALHAEPARRAALAEAGRGHVRALHAPAAVGALYHEAIEHFAAHSPAARYRTLLGALARLAPPRGPAEADLVAAAAAIAANRPAAAPRQLLVDISALVQADHKTGIQRVVRSIVLALFAAPPAGYRVEPVFSEGGNHCYRYARRFTEGMLGVEPLGLEDAPIEVRAGDHFLGLDLFTNGTTQNEALLASLRRRGVRIDFVVYDLLPLLRPEAFPFGAEKYYGDYLDTVSHVADGVVCISRAVADELAGWLATRPSRRAAPLQLGWFHLGADIAASAPSSGLPADAGQVLAALAAAPTLLMVGTLEPRKGQAQALAACELLWAKGVELNLVVVGKTGWLVDGLVKRLEQHPQRGRRLFWLPGVSDEMLLKLYAGAAALLAASEAEGFGLPLIEAAGHGLPIIARGIPVFREVAGEHAYYFDGVEPAELAGAVERWLALRAAGAAPASAGLRGLSWAQSAEQLLGVVLGGHWYRALGGNAPAPQLLVDVSAICRNDLQTGIERVVRAQLAELLRTPTTRYQVRPVYLSDEGDRWHYRHARRYSHRLLGVDEAGISDDAVRVGAGDVFYSPDFFPGAVVAAAAAGLYREWRQRGVAINFLVHDLLPVLQPLHFPPDSAAGHARWLACVGAEADRLVCISAAVADELRRWLAEAGLAAPAIAVLHHGADLAASAPSVGLAADAEAVLARLAASPAFLMVGTIEPRKGHLQALEAFERLWADGVDAQLVIVGREGWRGLPAAQRRSIPAVVARLQQHPEAGRRLHWLAGISDEYLERVYAASACLLVPSEGEGFGLPLIEAARHRLPVLARDLPVFREVAGGHAAYFSGHDGAALALALRAWLAGLAAGGNPPSDAMPWLSWTDNVAALTALLFEAAADTATPNPAETE
ncbi:glycosyltransferase [Rugamonas rubra]|uniref:Glycosyltransferase involved in cell wall bisynthesis n=1 Tax=Rugamonas rubra TaxID=758825 RepID=A0A1I4I3H1_9BURK|nr:glycosyltransferase [Rugamonas rubra]SFL48804.1 Glycosyltransferase involved in cell wall bisynthesis [Rugamonas rubra]